MKIFFSIDDRKEIKKNYKDLVDIEFGIIDVPEISEQIEIGLSRDNLSFNFVFSKELENKIKYFYNSKRYKSILYILENIDGAFVSNFKKYIESIGIYFVEYILLDPYQKIDISEYKYFDYVL